MDMQLIAHCYSYTDLLVFDILRAHAQEAARRMRRKPWRLTLFRSASRDPDASLKVFTHTKKVLSAAKEVFTSKKERK